MAKWAKKRAKAAETPAPQFERDSVVYRRFGMVWGPRKLDGNFYQYLSSGAEIIARGTPKAMAAAARLLGAS